MKKYFEVIGFIVLAMFSFFYTSKTINVVKNTDEIMIKIKEDKDSKKTEPIDAVINDDMIIPGISGTEVDISASYDAMKKVGSYSPNLLIYKKIKPNISISNIYNKYVNMGNSSKKQVSIIFKVDNNDDIGKILEIADKNDIKVNFFALDNLDDNILNLVSKGHNVGSVNNTVWVNTLVTKVANQKDSYCYIEEKNKEILDMCALNKSYTIIPNIIANNTPTLVIKKNLESGSIISMEINKTSIKEFEYIIRYIKSKGFNIVNLENLLEE